MRCPNYFSIIYCCFEKGFVEFYMANGKRPTLSAFTFPPPTPRPPSPPLFCPLANNSQSFTTSCNYGGWLARATPNSSQCMVDGSKDSLRSAWKWREIRSVTLMKKKMGEFAVYDSGTFTLNKKATNKGRHSRFTPETVESNVYLSFFLHPASLYK